jgi:co-chaperonin GroES (HSP10)
VTRIIPTWDQAYIRTIPPRSVTAGGILLPDVAKDKPTEGVIISLGCTVSHHAPAFVPGMTVMFKPYGGSQWTPDADETTERHMTEEGPKVPTYVIIDVKDIVAIKEVHRREDLDKLLEEEKIDLAQYQWRMNAVIALEEYDDPVDPVDLEDADVDEATIAAYPDCTCRCGVKILGAGHDPDCAFIKAIMAPDEQMKRFMAARELDHA